MAVNVQPAPLLSKSYKGRCPFTLATTSFIYPADYVSNVNRLGPYVDEIELLCFEHAHLPARGTIEALSRLSGELGVTYNVHLPTDLSIADRAGPLREKAVQALLRTFERVEALSPTTCTLHIPCDGFPLPADDIERWRERVRMSLEKILGAGVDPGLISVETLDYPPGILKDLIDAFGLGVCLDAGHLILQGGDVEKTFADFEAKTAIVHLHGVRDGKDHLALDRLPHGLEATLTRRLASFKGVVSLEVFSFHHLAASLTWLESRLTPSAAPAPHSR
jgi:sugar phosphate isomerase/epimerase